MPVIPGDLFAGVDPVIDALVARLEGGVPDELDRLEAAAGRPVPPLEGETDLWRPPGLYARSDRAILEPDDYPAVLVVPQATGTAYILDIGGGAVEWRIPYVMRVWAFTRYWTADGTAACRNRLATAILGVLFRSPKLVDRLAISLTGWRQSFSDVGVDDRDDSSVAGWWVEFAVDADERVGLDAPAVADTVAVAVHPEAD